MPNSYLLKITLREIKPAIWRRFVVPSDITLEHLHEVIQIVMGWSNSHMHQFYIDQQNYMPQEWCEDGELPEEKYKLEKVVSRKGEKFHYVYDFGDSWEHELVVENLSFSNPDWPYPICCTEGARACPPEDCGGVYGYADFCEAIADPKHPEHRELKSWFDGKFDPEHFDLAEVNKILGVKQSKPTTKKTAKKTVKKRV